MDALSILSAVGFGALLTIPLQYYFNERAKRKTMLFQEKKEAFVGRRLSPKTVSLAS
jgi:hypothetical protein